MAAIDNNLIYYNAREDYARDNKLLDSGQTGRRSANPARKRALIYTAVTVFCFVFATVYNIFSHGVHSPYMTWLFLWPLALGWIPSVIQWLRAGRIEGTAEQANTQTLLSANLYHSGVAALTVSSMLRGIFEIAGNSSPYQTALMIFGAVMTLAGIIARAAESAGYGMKKAR